MPLPTSLVSDNYLVTNARLVGITMDKEDNQRGVDDVTVANLTQTKQSYVQPSEETMDKEDKQHGVDDADLTEIKQSYTKLLQEQINKKDN